ncbi:mRNA cap guanine-N7 methyltransferase [Tilletia horrida]|nr:mRNA cap guanine-N7 methyltransferase [Tilletia horrida]
MAFNGLLNPAPDQPASERRQSGSASSSHSLSPTQHHVHPPSHHHAHEGYHSDEHAAGPPAPDGQLRVQHIGGTPRRGSSRPGSSGGGGGRHVNMSVEIPPPFSSSLSSSYGRPSHIAMPSPSGGMSRTSISNLLGDSVESPRSRPILSGTSSPIDEGGRKALHPPWPPGADGGPASGSQGHGMSFLLNNGMAGAVDRKTSRSASASSSSHGHGPPPMAHLLSTSSVPGAGSGGYSGHLDGRVSASAPPPPVPASPSNSASEISSTTGPVMPASGSGKAGSIVGRVMSIFRRKDTGSNAATGGAGGSAVPSTVSPYGSASGGAGMPPSQAGPNPRLSMVPQNQSPSGGSMMSLPMTPGTPRSPAEYPFTAPHPHSASSLSSQHHHPHQHYHPHAHPAMPQQHQLQPGPQGSYMARAGSGGSPSEIEYGRRGTGPAYADGIEYSPTMTVHQGSAHQIPPPHYHHPHPHHLTHTHSRNSLSPTTLVTSLPPPGPYHHNHPQTASHLHTSDPSRLVPPHAPQGVGSDMSPPPVPASTSRASTSHAPSTSASAPRKSTASADAAATSSPPKKRARANRDSTTPGSSRPVSPATEVEVAPVLPAGLSDADYRDPKVNIKRLPPPKFAKANGDGAASGLVPSPGEGPASSTSSNAAGSSEQVPILKSPALRTTGAPKDWMSAGISSAAVGIATGLDGGAGAAAAAAAGVAATTSASKEKRERQKQATQAARQREESQQDSESGPAKRRKSSSSSTTAVGSAAKKTGAGVVAKKEEGGHDERLEVLAGAEDVNMEPVYPEEAASVPNPNTLAANTRPDQAHALSTGTNGGSSNSYVYKFESPTLPSSSSSAAAAGPMDAGPSARPKKIITDPIPYAPKVRRTPEEGIRRPIYEKEIQEFKMRHQNPLRWKYEEEMAGLVSTSDRDGTTKGQTGADELYGGAVATSSVSNAGPSAGALALKRKRESSSQAGLPPPPAGRDWVGSGSRGNSGGATMLSSAIRSSVEDREREPASKKRFSEGAGLVKGPDNNEVSDHYNNRKEVGVHARRESKIFPLKNFNNWAKNCLIQRFSRDGARVLDLGCGKGGDLNKWSKARAKSLVMIDIAGMSVGQAETRFKQRNHGFDAEFYTFDCFARALHEVVPSMTLEPMFDTVTLQFCMHYGWSSPAKARTLLENVARYLRPGGYFIGTIPDADNLISRLKALRGEQLKFGNDIYSVTFEQKETQPPFGNKYWFFLEDAVEDVPEYVVEWDQFQQLATEFGLRLVYRRTFEQMYYDAGLATPQSNKADWAAKSDLRSKVDLPKKMGDIPMQRDMWEACCLYLGFAFERADDRRR